MTGADFVSVGKENVDLTSIKVGGDAYTAGDSFDEVEIQILKYDGSTDATYMWLDSTGDFDPGWYDDYELVEEGSVSLPAGQGFWIPGLDGLELRFPALTL